MKKLYVGILSLMGCVLLALYQNIGRLSQNETRKQLQMPHYFSSIYEEQNRSRNPKTMNDYESMLYSAPLYKKLLDEITIRGGSKGCDPSDPNVICPPDERVRDDLYKERMSLSFDPARTAALIRVNNSWRGQVNYDSPTNGAHIEVKKFMSQSRDLSSELKLQYDQGNASSKVSVEIKW